MTKDIIIKGKNDKPIPVAVNKGEIVNRNYKRVVNLSKNETVYSQGDGVIKIAPFDNYYLFTIYSEMNLEDVPVDLNNMGEFYLVFKDKKSEVRIKNFTNTKDINISAGQILFKISQEDAEKILSLSTDIFYVTSAIITNDSKSDETVIYSGKFAEFNKVSNDSLTETINSLKKEIDDINSTHLIEKTDLQNKINELNDLVNNLQNSNNSLSEQLSSYKNLCDILSTKVTNDVLSEAQEENQQAQQAQQEQQNQQTTTTHNELKKKPASNLFAFDGLQITGIASSISKSSSKIVEDSEIRTEADAKRVLGNLEIKDGILHVIGYIVTSKTNPANPTKISNKYMACNIIINSINSIISANKNNNIVCTCLDKDTDKQSYRLSYNITTDSIVVAKSPSEIWGRVELTENSSVLSIAKNLINIIKSNNK